MSRHRLYGHPDVREVAVPVATVWTGPDAPRDIDHAAVQDDPDVAGWTAAMDGETRKGLDGRTLTQLLLGEGLRVVEDRGEWVRVVALLQDSSADPQGYPGWVRRAHLGAPVMRATGRSTYVMARSSVLEVDGVEQAVSFGTGLWVERVGEQTVQVLLPGDRTGTLPLRDVRLSHKDEQPACAAEDILTSARQFLGLRYLWGGTSGWGLDCSGLVHLTYRAHGILLPRDAFDQAARVEQVEPVALDAVRAGDLYFFARPGERIYHVGFATGGVQPDGTRLMLHAPETGEGLEEGPMAPHRLATLVSAGRVRGPGS